MNTIEELLEAYKEGLDPKEYLMSCLKKAEANKEYNCWITLLSEDEILKYLSNLPDRYSDDYPLYGVPFAIKDNIDLENVSTSVACPGFAYTPSKSSFVVELLIKAGAIPLGKTNMDQFATGLVGTRSPFGQCKNSIDPNIISGGSSSGSAVSVALNEVLFSLGTDTAGSGRVPAALNNIWGLKPSKGKLSCTGVVPACKSLDCVSIFSKSTSDINRVLEVCSVYDDDDFYAVKFDDQEPLSSKAKIKIGVPDQSSLNFFENKEYESAFNKAVSEFKNSDEFEMVDIDYSCFKETAEILYGGPWVAERFVAIEEYLKTSPSDLDPAVSSIVLASESLKTTEGYKMFYTLQQNIRRSEKVLAAVDFIITPTIGTFFKREEIDNDPIGCNSKLGYYTNHMNLLDLCGVAFPAGEVIREDVKGGRFPFGLTLQGKSGKDKELLLASEKLSKRLIL